MWIPKDEQDIITAAASGGLEESVTFDAKREIPAKNSDTAKDVASLANTVGGVLLYGVDEDTSGRQIKVVLLSGRHGKHGQAALPAAVSIKEVFTLGWLILVSASLV
jgi:predicted HTH transcriptional regulator